MAAESIYSRKFFIVNLPFIAAVLYWMKPHTVEAKHYHKIREWVFIINGNCQTHRKHHFYFYRNGQAHEVKNDSSDTLFFFSLTVPRESDNNTFFV